MGKGKWLAALVATAIGFGGAAPAAQAAFDVTVASAGPSNRTAGAHSDVVVDMAFPDAAQDVRNLDIDLPAGLLGNPNAVSAVCTRVQFATFSCPAASQVGSVSTVTNTFIGDLTVNGDIYLITPSGGEPARMGITLSPLSIPGIADIPKVNIEAPIRLRAPGDYGLTATIRDLPDHIDGATLFFVPNQTLVITVKAMTMTLKGTPPTSPKGPFLTNPTECTPATFVVRAAPYSAPTSYRTTSAAFTPTGCATAPFAPTLDVAPKQQRGDQPTPLSVAIGFPADAGGTAQSHLKSAVVVLPVGTALSAGVGANGLEACTDDQFAASSSAAPSCPAASRIGSVSFVTPLLGELAGDVYLGTPTADAPLRLFTYAAKGDVRVKLGGRVSPDPQTGQLTTTFTDLPRVPFTSFTLAFRGGDDAVLKAPRSCGTNTATARLEPYARPGTSVTRSATFTTVDCPTGTFAPTLSADVAPAQATADTHMTMTVARGDDQPLLDGMHVTLPPGMLGHLADIPACAPDAARSGDCPEASRVGTVTALAGTGNAPASLDGPIYLTGPVGGGLAGLAIVVPARVGPIDLGKVVVVASLKVRGDVGIDVSASGMPRIIGGVPLAIRSLKLALDRDGFLFNASSCAPQTIAASFTGQGGETASASAPYQPSGCAGVPFAPRLTAAIGGSTTAPSLTTTIRALPGQGTLAGAQLTLPAQVGADLAALGKVCMKDQYDAGTCPATATVGTATAISPLVPLPLEGPVTLVRVPGRALPNLAVDLSGVLSIRLMVESDSAGGRLRATVAGIPDVPLTSFTLNLASGGLLKSDRSMLCTGTPRVDAVFTSHTGARATTGAVATTPCGPQVTASASLTGAGAGRTPSLRVTVRGSRLRSLRLTLPRQLELDARRLRAGGRALQGGRTMTRRTALPHTRTTVTARATKATGSIELRLGKGALRRRPGLKVGRTLTLRLRVTDDGGTSRALSVRVTPRR